MVDMASSRTQWVPFHIWFRPACIASVGMYLFGTKRQLPIAKGLALSRPGPRNRPRAQRPLGVQVRNPNPRLPNAHTGDCGEARGEGRSDERLEVWR
jgi:hypothetical protein